MSGHGPSFTPRTIKNIQYGIFVIAVALAYQYKGMTFLTDSYNLTSSETKEIAPVNVDGVPADTFFEVAKVVDGDTLHIRMGGEDVKVRLIGINTPETVDPRRKVECFGKEASSFMKSLAEGESVRIETDPTQGTYDSYRRMLAYVYLKDGQMLNRKMIAEGYAYEYTYMTPYKYQTEFRRVQNLAKQSERGLWAQNTCGGKK
jgi:micrococcal nuclease